MLQLDTQAKKWGNSLGIVIPSELAKKEGIKSDEPLDVLILRKSDTLKETFGTLKQWKKSAQQLKNEARAELYV